MKRPLLILLLFVFAKTPAAQDSTVIDSEKIMKGKLYKVVAMESAFYVGGISYLQYVWYRDHERVPFHFYNDNKGYLQTDKFGHAYGAYIESYISYFGLRNAGISKKKALIYGAPMGFFLQAPIEIFDGIYEGWGFSWGDMAANAAGSILVIGQELLWDEQLIKNKFTYSNSPYADMANGYLGETTLEKLFYDYNGHTYWLSAPIKKLIPVKKLPDWISISAGYSANGMFGEFENISSYIGKEIPDIERYRQYLLSLDIDWTKIKTGSKVVNTILKGMAFVKLPFPAIEINSKNQMVGYWIYY